MPPELVSIFDQGIRTFLSPESTLELNLPGEIKRALVMDAQATVDPCVGLFASPG